MSFTAACNRSHFSSLSAVRLVRGGGRGGGGGEGGRRETNSTRIYSCVYIHMYVPLQFFKFLLHL